MHHSIFLQGVNHSERSVTPRDPSAPRASALPFRFFCFLLGSLAILRFLGSLRLGAGVRGNGPLGNLDANLILAGLEGHAVVRNVDDFAHHTADRDDIVTDFQIGTHFIELFLLLVLRKDQEQVEDDKHQNDHDNG